MALPLSLDVHVPWDSVCVSLGLPIRSRSLPQVVRCPVCQRQATLHVFHDNNQRQTWHQCHACGQAGDMLDLAAATLKTTPSAAMQALVRRGQTVPQEWLQPDALKMLDARAAIQHRRRAFWRTAGQALEYDRDAGVLTSCHQLFIRWDGSHSQWLSGPARIIGSAACTELETVLVKPGIKNHKPRPIFRGKGWSRTLVIPFFGRPGQIVGFLSIARLRETEHRQYLSCPELASLNDAGLAGTDNLAGDDATVIAVSDPELYLRAQFRTFPTSLRPLPMVLWHHDDARHTRHAWDALENRRIVFWSAAMDVPTLLQVIQTDGYLSQVHRQATSVDYIFRRYPGRDLAKAITGTAVPWRDAVQRWIAEAPIEETNRVLTGLEQHGADVRHILSQCCPSAARRQLLPAFRSLRLARDKVIIERDDAWFAGTSRLCCDEQILNCIVKILVIIRDRDSQELFGYGRIYWRRKALAFIAPLSMLQNNLAEFLQVKLAEHDLGPLLVHADYTRHLYRIVCLWHEPTMRHDDLWRWTRRLQQGELRERRASPPLTPLVTEMDVRLQRASRRRTVVPQSGHTAP